MAMTNAQRQFIRELNRTKGRRKYSAFVVEGLVNVAELLSSRAEVDLLLGTEQGLGALRQNLPADASVPRAVEEVGAKELSRVSGQVTPSGVLAVAKTFDYPLSHLAALPRVLYFDGVNDPGNAGTLLRSAEWFGVDAVLASPGSVDWYNPKVVAAARGSLFRLPHLTVALPDLLHAIERPELVVADLDGHPSHCFAWPASGILLIGSESHGPGAEARELLSQELPNVRRVTIRGAGRATESLNAGVAGSILMAAWGGGL